jgi:PKHD-type hydroxylase
MYRILQVLKESEIEQCRSIAASVQFADGRITNPHFEAKKNEQLLDQGAHEKSAQLIQRALLGMEEFHEFAFPVAMAPPMLTRYRPGMQYGAHSDSAFVRASQTSLLRTDISCTVFLSDPDQYEGGALRIRLGEASFSFKLKAGEAILYPSDTLHEVEPVTSGERLVAITFIQSRIADPFRRNLLYELNEVAALEGLKMDPENRVRLQLVRDQLLRHWSDKP